MLVAAIAALLLAASPSTAAADQATPPQPVSFSRDIAPILVKKCQVCHGAEKAKGRYQLHTFENLLKPGSSKEKPVEPGNPAASEFFRLLVTPDADERMPQDDEPLPPAQIALIQRWIEEGALFDGADSKAELASLIPRSGHPAPPEVYPHPVPITALAFSPDGGQLAASGYHEVTVWDPSDGSLLRRIQNMPKRVHRLAWHPGGELLAVAGGSPGESGELALLNTVEGVVAQVLSSTPEVFLCATFNHDGSMLAAGGADGAITLYELPGGKLLRRMLVHADWVTALAFSPDGSRLVSASRDRSARIIEVATGEVEVTYAGHEGALFGAAFHPEGKTAFTAGRDRRIHVWSVDDGRKTADIGGISGDVYHLLIRGEALFSASADRLARQHAVGDRKLIHTYTGHADWVYSLAINPSGDLLATGGYNGEVRIWNLKDGSLAGSFVAAPGINNP